jgi:hypothetical protein
MRRYFASSPFFVFAGFDFFVSDGAFSWASEGRENAAHAMAINAEAQNGRFTFMSKRNSWRFL